MKPLAFLIFILFSAQLFSSEFDCERLPDSSAEILHCKGYSKFYPQAIHFYIPQNLNSTKKMHLFVHFHGHNIKGYDHFSKDYGNYGSFLLDSMANAVLVIPESLGKCTTYEFFFADQKRTAQFFLEIKNNVEGMTLEKINSIALSGHSGAYRVLNRLLGYSNLGQEHLIDVKALGMFDATYGATPEIVKWVNDESYKNHDYLFYNAFVTGSKATAEEGSLALEKQFKNLSAEKIFFIPVLGPDSEGLTLQHFNILKRGSLTDFWKRASFL